MLEGLRRLLELRRDLSAFSPFADQQVERLDPRVFVVRRATGSANEVVSAINVSDEEVKLSSLAGVDVFTGRHVDGITLAPFGFAWVRTRAEDRLDDARAVPAAP